MRKVEKHDIVYHYCTFESFLKIIEGKSLRFSDIKKSNDNLEIDYFWNHFHDYIKRRYNSIVSKNEEIEDKKVLDKNDFLACCFSYHHDDLNMWSRYVKEGGVAIGFNRNKLEQMADSIEQKYNYFSIKTNYKPTVSIAFYGEVIYYNKTQIDEFIEKECQEMNFADEKFEDFYRMAAFCKTDCWQPENEWRIVLPIIYNSAFTFKSDGDSLSKIDIQYSVDWKYGFKPFCLLPIEPDYIERIVISPNCNIPKTDIKKLLLLNGIDLCEEEIIESKINLK